MKNVEMIRKYIAQGQAREWQRLRVYISMLGGENTEVLDRMREREGEIRLARIVETVMAELGHQTAVTADDSRTRDVRSKARRAVGRI